MRSTTARQRPADRQRRAARQRPSPRRNPPGHRPHRARYRLRTAVARRRGQSQPRGVPRWHPDSRRRRRHRREPVQQEPAAVGRRRDRHPADAGDRRR
ncbi:hypothetical protein G6F50_017448 [Rhizopus delemar]|uniref:Uncharacterized protein n=1 Tax=Rhizopus delemar TaxID=936053 RepID=A0A9P6XQL3_9FUNG|nr:hypothetical protein G6F50_017448 [Rhizopus delemar]